MFLTALAAATIAIGAAPSVAQKAATNYPTRAVTIVVPYVPGGFPDTLARIVGQKLQESLGQTFIIDNRPGAAGIAATEYVAKAAPDGYIVLMADRQQMSISPAIHKNLPYDPVKSFAPVSLLGNSQQFLFVAKETPVSTLKEMIALVKANPGKYNYGTPGVASTHHLLTESLMAATGMKMVHVPYKGGAQVVPALVAGEITFAFQAWPNLGSFYERGAVKLLGAAIKQRSHLAPDVPTFEELGVHGLEAGSAGILAPAGTPPDVVAKLSAELRKAIREPDVKKRLDTFGVTAVGTTPDEFAAWIKADIPKIAAAVRNAGLKPE
jgi:tripartite-type tricarboxylate transporter receptor subunit TctC